MKRALVVAPSLKTLGGGEYVTLKIIESLKEIGIDVNIATFELPQWSKFKDFFGIDIQANWLPLFPQARRFPNILRDMLTYMDLMGKRGFIVINAIANEMPLPSTISYIHALHFLRSTGIKKRIGAELRSKYLSLILKASRRILIVSSFLARILYHKTKCKAIVLYPPCKMLPYTPGAKHKNLILTTSRFSPEKNLHIIPSIAQRLKEAKFVVVGSISNTTYFNYLLRTIKVRSLNNVSLIPNPPRLKYENLVSASSIYLHTMPFEPFPISVVEAMSAGNVPIVPQSGGAWEDMLMKLQGVYGYAWRDVEEAVNYINELLRNDNLRKEISLKAHQRAIVFSEQNFKKRFQKLVKQMLN